jgi:acyl-CoA dehydrogenase
MTENRSEIRDAIQGIVARTVPGVGVPVTTWDKPAWTALIESGFAGLGIDDAVGGSGGELTDVLDAVDAVSAVAACTPLIEHGLAGWLVAEAGVELPTGTGTIGLERGAGIITVTEVGGQERIDGTLRAVPWAPEADWLSTLIVTDRGTSVAVVDMTDAGVTVRGGSDLSGVPLGDVIFDRVRMLSHRACSVQPRTVQDRGALIYAAAMAAAARAVCDATAAYTTERTQFGRPLSKFQAIQQRLAQLASTTALMEQAVADANAAVASGDSGADVALAAAKLTASSSARAVAAAGHQLHGAIGYTSEHALGRHTMSLLSWRDRWGNEDYWAEVVAAAVLDDGPGVWGVVTGFGAGYERTSA